MTIIREKFGDKIQKLTPKAFELLKTNPDNVSIAFLQRKLRIGYPVAAGIMENLEEQGYVSEYAPYSTPSRRLLV